MPKNNFIALVLLMLGVSISAPLALAQANDENNGIGQSVQINTRIYSWLGKPTWILNIYDVDNGLYYPYVYDIRRGRNNWLAFSYGRTYRITASTMHFVTYDAHSDRFRTYTINNFCHLQTGRNIRDESLYVSVEGDLNPYSHGYTCNVVKFPESNFTIVPPPEDDTQN
jgi:hypothetical protein